MKTLTKYQSKKDANVTAVATGEKDNKIILWNKESGNMPTTKSTVQRWWKKIGEVSEAEVLAEMSGKSVKEVENEMKKSEAKNNQAEAPKEEPKAKETKKNEGEKKPKTEKKPKGEKKPKEPKAPKPWTVKGHVAEVIEEIAKADEKVYAITAVNQYKSVLSINGIRRVEFNSSRIRVKPADAEKAGIECEVKKYSSAFKGKVNLASTTAVELKKELEAIFKKF